MELENMLITEIVNTMRVDSNIGRKTFMRNRYCSAIIITLYGRIVFSQNQREIITDVQHPIFLSEGASYDNVCIEPACSLLFNFRTAARHSDMLLLPPLDPARARIRFERMEMLAAKVNSSNHARFAELYALLGDIFSSPDAEAREEKLLEPALKLMLTRFQEPDLSCEQLAAAVGLSPAYFRKVFLRKFYTTPYQYLFNIRMNKAQAYLLEHRAVKDVALSVGYSDIYQFSRAYKRKFGCAPTRMLEK